MDKSRALASATRILNEELNKLKDRIADNIMTTNTNASGKTIASMHVEVEASAGGWRGTLYGRPFFGTLETGSSAWRNKDVYKHPPRWFAEIIQEWIEAKGLTLNAYAVAYKIMKEGTSLKRAGGRSNIYSNEIPRTLDIVAERFAVLFQEMAVDTITLNNK